MRIQVIISWPNAGSPLLPEDGASVNLLADGRPLSPLKRSRGERVFEIPDGTTSVRLIASFWAVLGPVAGTAGGETSIGAEVLRVDQMYTMNDGMLLPRRMSEFDGPHPLANVKGIVGASGAVSITLRTEFVDIRAFWSKYAAYWREYEEQHNESAPGCHLVPLGYTGGSPLIWFASFPAECLMTTEPDVSCLVFFRPANYAYTKVDQPHDMIALSRYLLAPKCEESARDWAEQDHIVPLMLGVDMAGRHYLRCGFERGLLDSSCEAVMLHPWPSGDDYGAASTNALPSLCESAIRFLWALGAHPNADISNIAIGKGLGGVRLGRLGLSAYSRGGRALWSALQANMRRVEEVYAFDCNDTAKNGGLIAQWYTAAAKDPRLRMVGGAYNVAVSRAVARTIRDIGLRSAGQEHVTLALCEPNWFAPGKSPYWEHVIKDVPELRNDLDVRHQFAIFGGSFTGVEKDPHADVEGFLATFLSTSAFNTL